MASVGQPSFRYNLLGLALDARGDVYACDLNRHEVLRIDPTTGSVIVLSTGTESRPMRTPNYPAFDDDGRLFLQFGERPSFARQLPKAGERPAPALWGLVPGLLLAASRRGELELLDRATLNTIVPDSPERFGAIVDASLVGRRLQFREDGDLLIVTPASGDVGAMLVSTCSTRPLMSGCAMMSLIEIPVRSTIVWTCVSSLAT